MPASDSQATANESAIAPVRLRGLVAPGWIQVPVVTAWIVGVAVAFRFGWREPGDHLWHLLGVYGCAGFFGHAYFVAWRAGTYVRRMSVMVISMALFVFLAWFHADAASSHAVYVDGVARTVPTRQGHFVAVCSNLLAAALLLIHALILGFGSRAPRSQPSPADPETPTDGATT